MEAQGRGHVLFYSIYLSGFFQLHIHMVRLFFKWPSDKDISLLPPPRVSTFLPLKHLQGPVSVCPSRGDLGMYKQKYTNINVKIFLKVPVGGPCLVFCTHLPFYPEQYSLKKSLELVTPVQA